MHRRHGGVTIPKDGYAVEASAHGGVSLPHPEKWNAVLKKKMADWWKEERSYHPSSDWQHSNVDAAFFNTLAGIPGWAKQTAQDINAAAPWNNEMRPENVWAQDLDPGNLIDALQKQFRADWASDKGMAVQKLAGSLMALGLTAKAAEAVPEVARGQVEDARARTETVRRGEPEILPPEGKPAAPKPPKPVGPEPLVPVAAAPLAKEAEPAINHPQSVSELARRAEADRAVLNPQPAETAAMPVEVPLPKAAEEPVAPLPKAAPQEPAPPFFLKSQQVINEKMRGPMPADAVRNMLLNAGVKEEEMKWTGLDDLLAQNKKITPEEIKQHLADNNVQIQEVHKGPQPGAKTKDDWALSEYNKPYDQLDASAQHWVESMMGYGDYPKYAAWQLHGGSNYRELLLTLPTGQDYRVVPVEGTSRWKVVDQNGESRGEFYDRSDAERAAKVDTRQSGFQSTHWDEPNVLAHVRFNDRTGPNGEKLLHLEEVQSDWHQKGREKGYAPAPLTATVPLVARQTQSGIWEVTTTDGRFVTNVQNYNKAFTADEAIAEAHRRIQEEPYRIQRQEGVPDAPFKKTWHELALKRMLRYASEHGYQGISWTPGEAQAERYDLSKQISKVEYDPHEEYLFAYDTNGRRVIDEEYVTPEKLPDYIGKEAANKLLPKIEEWRHDASPEYSIHVGGPGNQLYFLRDANGDAVRDSTGNTVLQFPTRVRALREITFMQNEERVRTPLPKLEGLDLKIGGEGMRGFYDKIIPDYLNKYGKRWGAKVGTLENVGGVPQKELEAFDKKVDDTYQKYQQLKSDLSLLEPNRPGQYSQAAYLNKQEAARNAWEEHMQAIDKYKEAKTRPTRNLPYIPITQEMRQSVMQTGQPLFKEAPPSGPSAQPPSGNAFQFVSSFTEVPVKPEDTVEGYTNEGQFVHGRVVKAAPEGLTVKTQGGNVHNLDRTHLTHVESRGEQSNTAYTADQATLENVKNNVFYKAIGNIANRMADKFAMQGKINVSTELPTFVLNGETRKAAGHYLPNEGTITIYSRAFTMPKNAEGVMAHEIGHKTFMAVWGPFGPGGGAAHTPEIADLMTDDFLQKLSKDDGATPYSTDWWDATKSGLATVYQAINETIAELFQFEHQCEADGAPQNAFYVQLLPSWQQLYKAVMMAARNAGMKVNYDNTQATVKELTRPSAIFPGKELLPKAVDQNDAVYYNAERRVGDVKEGPSLGTYLTTDHAVARHYANLSGNIRTVKLLTINPLRIVPNADDLPDHFTADNLNAQMKAAGVDYEFPDDQDDDEFWRFLDDGGKKLTSAIKKAGYDSLVYPDSQGYKNFETTLVFNPSKVVASEKEGGN